MLIVGTADISRATHECITFYACATWVQRFVRARALEEDTAAPPPWGTTRSQGGGGACS